MSAVCDVANQGCKAPPGLAFTFTTAACFACGMGVCTNAQCSRRIQYLRFGRKRICFNCQRELKKVAK